MSLTRKALPSHKSILLIGPMAKNIQFSSLEQKFKWVIVDGGINCFKNNKLKNILKLKIKKNEVEWIGDGDSKSWLPKEIPIKLFSPHKDQSDLELALENIPNTQTIYLKGFWGGRLDHHLANIGVVGKFCHRAGKIAYFHEGPMILGPGIWQLPPSKTFSLMGLERTKVELKGPVRYQLPKGSIISALSPWGISNVWDKKKKGKLILKCNRPLLFFASNMNVKPLFLRRL